MKSETLNILLHNDLKHSRDNIKSLQMQVERLKGYISELHETHENHKFGVMADAILLCEGKATNITIRDFPTKLLKEIWDGMYSDDSDYRLEAIIEDVHLELNMRGEGKYCAV